jgi:hypothetical protein
MKNPRQTAPGPETSRKSGPGATDVNERQQTGEAPKKVGLYDRMPGGGKSKTMNAVIAILAVIVLIIILWLVFA